MIDPIIPVLVALCSNANKIKGLVAKHFPSAVEKELLRTAAESGQFTILTASQSPYPFIRAGQSAFGDANDPASMATYLDAFKSLCSNGYVEHAGDQAFRLTKAGFDKARSLP